MHLAHTSSDISIMTDAPPLPLPRIAGYPLLGALPDLLVHHFEALDRWMAHGGDMFEVAFGRTRVKMITRGALAAEALVNDKSSYIRSPIFSDSLRIVAGDSTITLAGQEWRVRRNALQPKFRASVIARMVTTIDSALDAVFDKLEPGRINLARFCDRLTMSVGVKTMFGHSLTGDLFDELAELSSIVISRIALGFATSKLPRWLPLPGARRFRRSLARIDEIVLDMVEKRRASGDYGDDLLGMLLQMYADGDLDAKGVRDEAVTMVLAGYQTMSNSLSWMLHKLAQHPDVIAKIQAEADAVLDRPEPDVRELSYSMRVFKEGLRMFPSALWVVRQATEDTIIGQYPVAKGENIVCSPYLIHRNPQDWPDPERFDPDRFLGHIDARAFVPFGIGQHTCIGNHLALLEGQMALAKFFRRWDVVPVTDHVAQMRVSATLTNADGIYVELRPRSVH